VIEPPPRRVEDAKPTRPFLGAPQTNLFESAEEARQQEHTSQPVSVSWPLARRVRFVRHAPSPITRGQVAASWVARSTSPGSTPMNRPGARVRVKAVATGERRSGAAPGGLGPDGMASAGRVVEMPSGTAQAGEDRRGAMPREAAMRSCCGTHANSAACLEMRVTQQGSQQSATCAFPGVTWLWTGVASGQDQDRLDRHPLLPPALSTGCG